MSWLALDASKRLEKLRALQGTPFKHQGRLPGVGLDCIGVYAVIAPLDIRKFDRTDYGRDPVHRDLENALDRLLPVGAPPGVPGDVLLFEDSGSGRQHLGVVSAPGMMIHAQAGRCVCEVPIDQTWQRLLKKVYRWES